MDTCMKAHETHDTSYETNICSTQHRKDRSIGMLDYRPVTCMYSTPVDPHGAETAVTPASASVV
jgi:hypothetical protein